MSGPYKGDFPVNHTAVLFEWDSFTAASGASSAATNFAAADVLIYKDGSIVQRASASGITVFTSFDGQVGAQNILISLADNTDPGFYAAGHEYQVLVADVTVDTQTVRFWAGSFSIERAGGALALIKQIIAGTSGVNTTAVGGTAQTAGDIYAALTTLLARSAALRVKKSTALVGFMFPMTDSLTHLPATGLTPTVMVAIDGEDPVASVNAAYEVGLGLYAIDLAPADNNGNVVTYITSATNADTRYIQVITQD